MFDSNSNEISFAFFFPLPRYRIYIHIYPIQYSIRLFTISFVKIFCFFFRLYFISIEAHPFTFYPAVLILCILFFFVRFSLAWSPFIWYCLLVDFKIFIDMLFLLLTPSFFWSMFRYFTISMYSISIGIIWHIKSISIFSRRGSSSFISVRSTLETFQNINKNNWIWIFVQHFNFFSLFYFFRFFFIVKPYLSLNK